MRDLRPEPLTAAAFTPFGDVIETRGAPIPINYGHTLRFDDLAWIDVGTAGGRAKVSLFRGEPLEAPVLSIFERHPLGSQAFMPLSPQPYLVAVAPAGEFDPGAVRLFRAVGQGVNYARGVWHHFLLPLAPADFLVIDRAAEDDNLDEVTLAQADQIRIMP